jgi:purine-nucleoside phosphorylase
VSTFQKLFAVSPDEVRENVIVTPFLKLEYFKINGKSKKGFLFEVLNEDDFSVIKTGVGASFVGDALMYLKETKAKRVYFIGSCGVNADLNIGDLVLVGKVLNLESFSDILNNKTNNYLLNTDNGLYKEFLRENKGVRKVNLATVGSLSLQEDILPLLNKYKIDAVDMEVSAFVNAASFLKFSHLVLLYVTDILKSKPFHRDLTSKERLVIQESRQKAISLICEFIKKQNV